MNWSFRAFCWLLLLLSGRLIAQEAPYSFDHYGTEQGLSNDHITAIERDEPGFMWIGTSSGLNRFDGRRFRVFKSDPKVPESLPGDCVWGISPGPDGMLWISTNQGLCRLDPERLRFKRIPLPGETDPSAIDQSVSKMVFDHQGRGWCYGRKALHCVEPKTGNIRTFHPKTPVSQWQSLYFDHQDNFWVIANSGLCRFDPKSGETTPYPDAERHAANINAMDFSEDDRNTLWVTTWNNGMYRYDRTTDKLDHVISGDLGLNRRMLPDRTADGRLFFWLGGGISGLFLYFPEQGAKQDLVHDPRDPYTHNGLFATVIFKDKRTGDVWVGTEVGLEHYSPTAIRFGRALIPIEPDFGPFNMVSGAVQDNTDTTGQRYFIGIWANCFFAWNRKTGVFKRFKSGRDLGPVGDELFALTQGKDGRLWLDMAGNISRYNPVNGKTDIWNGFFRNLKRQNKILASVEDRFGNLWFGANADGLFRFARQDKRPVRIKLPEEAVFQPSGDLFVHSMAADSLGRIWLATNRCIIRYDPASGDARRFTIPERPASECRGITVGRNGQVWCTVDDWLVKMDLDGTIIRMYKPENGIRCSLCFFVLEDLQGNIWFNSDYLIHCLDTRTDAFTYYGQADGLFSNAPTDGLSLLPNGEIVIGFQNAFNYFNPAQLRRNTTPPPVVITSIRVLDKQRPLKEPLILSPGENMLTIEFAALNFSQPERNRYAYKLDGFDRDWNYTDRPVAVYTNLDGGQYTLHLKAANNDGVWNETGTIIRFQVVPPFYRQWFFYLALILLGAGTAYGIGRYRYLQRRRLDQFRERLARDLHDEMGSTLSSIRFFSDFAQTQVASANPETLPVLQRISMSATALSESMQDIIWAMKTREDHLEDIASRMTEFGLRLLEARSIRFVTHIDEQFPVKRLLPEQRRNLYLIFKEALNNAAKYAACTTVELVFQVDQGNLILRITDDGRGFDVLSKTAGNGLSNMRQRAAEIGGRYQIISAPGLGCSVEVTVKL